MRPFRPCFVVPLTLAGLSPAQAPIPAPLQNALPALGEQSVWAQDCKRGADQRTRGAYPLGNGQVFCYLGLGERANTLQALSGPSYVTDEEWAPAGNYGETTLELVRDGKPLVLEQQRVRRVRGAGFVVTEDAGEGCTLRTLVFAQPDRREILQIVEVSAEGDAGRGLTLRWNLPPQSQATGQGLIKVYAGRQRPCTAAFTLTGAAAGPDSLAVALPRLPWAGVARIAMRAGAGVAEDFMPKVLEPAEAQPLAQATLEWWQSKLLPTFHLDTDHKKLRDLVEDSKVLILAQRDARTGYVLPMIHHRVARARDVNGALAALLRLNLWAEARAIVKFEHDVVKTLGRVPTQFPLDLDLSGAREKKLDWNEVTVPPGDAGLWLILHHFWYWRVTHDTDLIEDHWPLLETCLKRVPRGKDSLIAFDGSETYLGGGLHQLLGKRLDEHTHLIAHDAAFDHATASFGNGVLFLLCVNALGELVDGIDKKRNPARWSKGAPEKRVSQPYTERTFKIMEEVEKRFWIGGRDLFAPAISPLTGQQHLVPFANLNLTPLWAGWTYPTGEKSRDNLRNSLKELWRRGTRIGTTPTCGYATGDLQGMLLVALCERDAKERHDALDDLLRLAEPAGEWSELFDPEGEPVGAADAQWPCRAHPGFTGLNVDAALFAINGIRYVSVPNWDNNDIRAELRMPRGATFVTMRDLKKDGRHLHVFMNEEKSRLTKEELEENEKKKPEDRRDANAEHRRLAFKMELLSPNPAQGYYDVGLNAMGTMFVRYLWHYTEENVRLADPDPKKRAANPSVIQEREFWKEDHDPFFTDAVEPFRVSPPPATAGAELLFLGARASTAEWIAGDKVTVVDTGLPFQVEQLAALLRNDDGTLRHKALFLDWGHDRPGAATAKSASFWSSDAWASARRQFEQLGGKVLTPGFFPRATLQHGGQRSELTAAQGAFSIPAGDAGRKLVFEFDAVQAREAVLRTGSTGPIQVSLNGKKLFERRGARRALPDADAELVTLVQGKSVVEITLDGSAQTVFARVSDQRGLPIE
jgi:hypothetical protein